MKVVVADSSPLIALARVSRIELLREIFGHLLVPDAVWREVMTAGADKPGAVDIAHADWIQRRSVADPSLVHLLRQDLGAGEAEAIVLARETNADVILMDERLGRSAARRLGLRVVGLVGVLIEARDRGLLADAHGIVTDLHAKAGFWLSEELRRLVTGE